MQVLDTIDRFKQFVSDSRQELRKVTWTTREQTIKSTWVVIVFVIIISILLGMVDWGISKLIRVILR